MKIDFTFKDTNPSEKIKEYAKKKSQKLLRHFNEEPDLRFKFTKDNNDYVVEASLREGKFSVFASYRCGDITAGIDEVVEILDKQMRREIDKVRDRKRKGGKNFFFASRFEEESEEKIEYKKVVPEVLSETDAKILLDEHGGAIVYRDQETQRINIMHRKRDGKIELIEIDSKD